MTQWHCVAHLQSLSNDVPLEITLADKELALYRIGDQIYALENICPHAYALLSAGVLEDDTIECPLHEAVFHIPTGRCLKGPSPRDLVLYPTRITANGDIELTVDEPLE